MSENETLLIRGHTLACAAPYLDGRHTLEEIGKKLRFLSSESSIRDVLAELTERGYLTETQGAIPPDWAAYWDAYGADISTVKRRLEHVHVDVLSVGDVDGSPLVSMLKSFGMQVNSSPKVDFQIVLTENYLNPLLKKKDMFARESQVPWLLLKPVGQTPWIGPFFYPQETGCWQCLRHRLECRQHRLKAICRELNQSFPPRFPNAALPSTHLMLLPMAVTAIVNRIVLNDTPLKNTILELDSRTFVQNRHTLQPLPNCPVCGSGQQRPFEKPALRSRRKQFTDDGGHRVCSPEETWTRYKHHVSDICGIVGGLTVLLKESAGGLVVYGSDYALSKNCNDICPLNNINRARCCGKGKTQIQAKVSALAEAIERYSGQFGGDERFIVGTMDQLGASAIHPNAIMCFSDHQYATRDEWNRRFGTPLIPEPFDPSTVIPWTPVWSMTHRAVRYIPTALCYSGKIDGLSSRCMRYSGNGASAGNVLEETVLQGFMEVLERDCAALWWYNRLVRPAVDLNSFGVSYWKAQYEYYLSIGRELWVLDIRSDFEIPAFVALSRNRHTKYDEIIAGFGAHFSAELAISRALTEMNQMLWNVQALKSGPETWVGSLLHQWLSSAMLEDYPFLSPSPSLLPRTKREFPYCMTDDLLNDIEICSEKVSHQNLELLILDQSRKDTNMAVAKVFVPGMLDFEPRLAHGRLYDTPIKMNWRDRPMNEADINPEVFPFQ
ncbi:MAG: TOMM precursor leader peptide-binding protein [Proteobacteria bacterium]|nr:TOMM precursor leader peptide-binding protein [Pseudomonadota bacterium]